MIAPVTATWLDRATWGRGPWDDEPDRVAWVDEDTGFPCILRRGQVGAWCGYVGLPADHPWHGRHYDDIDAQVHGDLTYAALCSGDPDRGVCHVADDTDTRWWIGFDCAHLYDLIPLHPDMWTTDLGMTYRDVEYVRAEVLSLARQAKAVQP